MVYGSKYEAIPKNADAVPGRVGMAECSLDLIFFKLETDHLFFCLGGGGGGGQGLIFFQQLKLDFFYRPSESIFCVIQSSTIAIRPYTLVKLQFHQNKNTSDQHS